MDIAEEKLMERIAVALERIAAALEVGKEAVLEASEDPATFPHTEKTPEKKEISNNEAMAALESFIKREGKKAAKDLLAAFGVERFSEILPEYYYDFWMACNGKA